MGHMAYQVFRLGDGREEVRCAPGEIVHIGFISAVGEWFVEEDPDRRMFHVYGDALDRARNVGKDPDWRPR
jgi:hypothetical protein